MDILIALFYFIIYSVCVLYFGKYGLAQSENLRVFFVANYGLKLWASVFTFCATWLSVTSVLAITGSFYLEGFQPFYTVIVGWFIGALLLFLIIKPIRQYKLLTVPEFFYKRYDSTFLQIWGGGVSVFTHLCYMIVQIYGFGITLSYLLDIPYVLSVFFVYLFLIYTTFGGLRSIARTDAINFVLIFISIAVLTGAVAIELHKKQAWEPLIAYSLDFSNHRIADVNIPAGYAVLGFMMMLMIWVLGKASHPQYLIRIISANNERTAKSMMTLSISLLIVTYVMIAFIGVGSQFIAPGYAQVNENEIILLVIQSVTDSKVGSFLFIAILASAISTANSQLHILSSSISYDIVRPLLKKPLNEKLIVNLNRTMILVGATAAVVIAIFPPQALLTFGSYLWGILAFSFFMPLYGGLLWKKASRLGAIGSMFTATVIGSLLIWYDIFVQPFDVLHPASLTIAAAAFVFIAVSLYEFKGRERQS